MQRPTPVLLLGTFHLEDAGRDMYKPQFVFDVKARQNEIEAVVERLANFAPTKIAVETQEQGTLDEEYKAYQEDRLELQGNEVHQFGFRLAKRLGHARVYAINAWGRFYKGLGDHGGTSAQAETPDITWDYVETYASDHGQLERVEREIAPYLKQFAEDDRATVERSLRETLLEINDPQAITEAHGVYLMAHFKVGEGDAYPGVDAATSWHNRNLRIFANVQRITAPGDRLLVIYGGGHTALLRHCFLASPEYELLEVSAYL